MEDCLPSSSTEIIYQSGHADKPTIPFANRLKERARGGLSRWLWGGLDCTQPGNLPFFLASSKPTPSKGAKKTDGTGKALPHWALYRASPGALPFHSERQAGRPALPGPRPASCQGPSPGGAAACHGTGAPLLLARTAGFLSQCLFIFSACRMP